MTLDPLHPNISTVNAITQLASKIGILACPLRDFRLFEPPHEPVEQGDGERGNDSFEHGSVSISWPGSPQQFDTTCLHDAH